MSPMTNLVAIQTSLDSRDLYCMLHASGLAFNCSSFRLFRYDSYNFTSVWHVSVATQAMSLRHAAAYAVFDKEEDIVKAARNLSHGASVISLQSRIVNHAQTTMGGVRMRYDEDAIRYYQILSDVISNLVPCRTILFKARWCSHTEILKLLAVESSLEELPFVSSTKVRNLARSGNSWQRDILRGPGCFWGLGKTESLEDSST